MRKNKLRLLPLLAACYIVSISNGLYAEENPVNVEQDESGHYYTVKKGDTLWDLSERFLNSPWYWPELWEANSDVPIPNPHLIYPGQKIRLFRRDKTSPYPAPETASSDTSGTQQFPDTSGDSSSQFGETGEQKASQSFTYSPINKVGFVRNPAIGPSGIIFKSKDDRNMISTGDTVYIRELSRTPLILGKLYTVYKKMGTIKDRITKEDIGVQHYFTGIIEIVKSEPDFHVAKVKKAYRTISINNLIMPFNSRSSEIEMTEGPKGLFGKIIGSEEKTNMTAENGIVFLDRGIQNGVVPGQEFIIFYRQKAELDPVSKKSVLLTPVEYARMIVLLTEQTTSTALITQSIRDIAMGSSFRSMVQ